MMCQKLNFNNRRQPHAMFEGGERQHLFYVDKTKNTPMTK
jgi:hypothetical protein